MIQLPSLSQILHKGACDGHEFAAIVKTLFEEDEKLVDGFRIENFDDCSGDIDGADMFIFQGLKNIYVQIRITSFGRVNDTGNQEVNWINRNNPNINAWTVA